LEIVLSVARRLREEREKLGFSQEKFGMAGGVKKLAQINYEKGVRSPDANYLAAVARAGADVCYILTGQWGGSQLLALSQEEQTMLECMRQASPVLRRAALSVLLSGQPSAGSTQPESRQPSVPEPSRQPARCLDDATSVASD